MSPPGGNYESGLQVTLTATATSGYTFDYWDGSIAGSLPIVDIIINSNKSITAHFKTIDISPTTTTSVSPITTTTITPPTTTPATIVTSNTWQLSGKLFLVNSKGINGYNIYEYVKSFYSNFFSLGSGMSYVYQNLEKYWLTMQGNNIIVLFNPSSEPLEILDNWPKQYKEAFPFSVSELTGINLPFALFKRQENGLIRAIILANSEPEIRTFLDIMKDKPVPVDIPWTLENGAVTQAINISPTPTTTTPATIVTSDKWKLSGELYLLTSQGTSTSGILTYLKSSGFQPGLLGGGMSYIFSRLGMYWGEIQYTNTIIIFNASAESVASLADWPTQYSEVCPFTVQELTVINLPFTILKKGNNGFIRTIIMANTDSEITAFLSVMNDQQVPVGIPWTLENGAVTQAKEGGGWYRPMKELSDNNFIVKYYEGYETDASNMLVWGEEVVGKLQNWFPDLFTIIGSRVAIIISDTGDPSHASADVTYPSLSFVSPSVAIKQNNYYDKNYYVGNIAHELGHVILDRYRKVAGGYQRADCPNWFNEGFGEYLKFLVLGQQTFDAKYSRYRSEISSMSLNGTSGISDVYAGGSWVLRFMGDKFGTGAIVSIVKSKQSTFWLAVTEQTGLTSTQFEEQLKEWLKTQ